MTMSQSEQSVIDAIFAYSDERRSDLSPNKRIAYYTTADTALRIIQNKTFWLRNPQLMNDFEEVLHGRRCLNEVLFEPEVLQAASAAIDAVFPGTYASLTQTWLSLDTTGHDLPFVACLSEIHKDDDRGRLSMWRAYGGDNGVALVMRESMLDLDSAFVNTFHSPVLYGDAGDVKNRVLAIFSKLAAIPDSVNEFGRKALEQALVRALQFAMLSIKHVGFEEEREWRMIHHYVAEADHHQYQSQVVRGNAQVICAINLASHPQLTPNVMFEKVIIGPCMFPEAAAQAFRLALIKGGVDKPEIVISDIPLRHI